MLDWVRVVCENKDRAMLLISRLEGRKIIFNQRNGEFVVEYERECDIIEGKYTHVEEDNKDELPKSQG